MGDLIRAEGWHRVDGILLDLGTSSDQLNAAARGFSFQLDGPLDMRMDSSASVSAADLVNGSSEEMLSDILWRWGEERWAKSIARAIVRERGRERIEGTLRLAKIVWDAIPSWAHPKRIHPATRTFQALRIEVNDELERLSRILEEGVDLLKRKGRFCILSYHSLEDRMVKEAFRQNEKACTCPPNFPQCVCGKVQRLRVITRRPIRPQPDEIKENPRSRSAKLRVAERV